MPDTSSDVRPRFRRGLVLQGGGAKGAFQWGVVREFHRRGLTFDIVAGTSVGALNAALVASHAWDLGDSLWRDLSLKRVFNWTGFSAFCSIASLPSTIYFGWLTRELDRLLPTWLRLIFTLVNRSPILIGYIAAMTYFYKADGREARYICGVAIGLAYMWFTGRFFKNMPFPLRYISFIVNRGGLFAAMIYCLNDASDYEAKYYIWATIGLAFICWSSAEVFTAQHSMRAVALFENLTLALLIALFLWLSNFRGTYPRLSLFLIAGLLAQPALVMVTAIHQWTKASIFTNEPLREAVGSVVRRGFRMPTIVAAAEVIDSVVDPDDYVLYAESHNAWGISEGAYPLSRRGFCASYLDIGRVSVAEAIDALIASAALPLSILPSQNRFGASGVFVDGGVADNTPWFPLIDDYPCEEIIIVQCSPRKDGGPTDATWSERDRERRVMKYPFEAPFSIEHKTVRNNPPTVIPFRKPQNWASRFVIVAPAKPLGGFLNATLNFNSKRARRNLELGSYTAAAMFANGIITMPGSESSSSM